MISSKSTILKNTVFLYIRMFVTMLVSLYTVRVVLKTLGVVDYGVYNVIGGVVVSIAFISRVLANASQRFFSVELGKGDIDNLRKTFNLLLLVYFCVAIIVLVLCETIGLWFLNTKMDVPVDRMDAANWVFQFAILSFLVSLLTSPFQSIIVAHEKMIIYAYMSIIDVVLKLAIVYVLVVFSFDKLKLYAVLMFLTTLLHGIIYLYISKRLFPETKYMFVWDKNGFKSIFGYSFWILIGSFSYMTNTQGLNILFNLFFGPIANAAYAIGNQVKEAVVTFAGNFYAATRPPIIKSYAQNDYSQTMTLFYFSSKIIFILLFVLVVPLFVGMDEILTAWLGSVSQFIPGFARLMLIYSIIICMSEPITTIAQAAGKVKMYHGIVELFTLLSLPIVYVVFKLGGSAYWGFGVAIIIFVIAHVIRLYILKSFCSFSLKQYLKEIVIPVSLSIGVVSIVMVGFTSLITGSIIVCMIVSFSFAVLMAWLVVLNKEERLSVVGFAKSSLHRA